MRPANARPTLGKGNTLVDGLGGGLSAKTDLGGNWNDTNLEFEIDPVDETPAGRAKLALALEQLELFAQLIDREEQRGYPKVSAYHLAAATGGASRVHHAYIVAATSPTRGNPQATAGVRLDQVAQLMEQGVGGHTGLPSPLVAPERYELGAGSSTSDFLTVGEAPMMVRSGIMDFLDDRKANKKRKPPKGFPSPSLVGLCSLMLTYMIKAGGPQAVAYAKQIAPLMARTNFVGMYNAVPQQERKWLQAIKPPRWEGLWDYVLEAGNLSKDAGAPLFTADPNAAEGSRLTFLTRWWWIIGLPKGYDLLTTDDLATLDLDAPGAPLSKEQAGRLNATQDPSLAGEEGKPPTDEQAAYLRNFRAHQLFGLGGFGEKTEAVGGGAVQAPIFELRRLMQSIDAHQFTEMALGVFDYITALNATDAGQQAPAYQRGNQAAPVMTGKQKRQFNWAV
jgi:hypothetical protein